MRDSQLVLGALVSWHASRAESSLKSDGSFLSRVFAQAPTRQPLAKGQWIQPPRGKVLDEMIYGDALVGTISVTVANRVVREAQLRVIRVVHRDKMLPPMVPLGSRQPLGNHLMSIYFTATRPLCGLAPEMLQNDPLQASCDHFAGWRLKCSKTTFWRPPGTTLRAAA